jgi:hypothetical protein
MHSLPKYIPHFLKAFYPASIILAGLPAPNLFYKTIQIWALSQKKL